jgi:hypothetical protein
MKSAMTQARGGHLAQRERGSAAIEALLIMALFVIPLWMLLINVSYMGLQTQRAQIATSLAAHQAVADVTAGGSADGTTIKNKVEPLVFPASGNTLDKVEVVEKASSGSGASANTGDLASILGGLSGHREVTVTVTRTPPYDIFPASNMVVRRTIGGTPYTYCENGGDLSKLNLSAGSAIMSAATVVMSVASYVLAPFGGLGTEGDKC